jgi:hypothetical protein
MEGRGSDGSRGLSLPWSYRREQTGSTSSYTSISSSGTIVSTTYTSRCSGSRLSSMSPEAAMRFFGLELDDDPDFVPLINKPHRGTDKWSFEKQHREERMKHIGNLVHEFFWSVVVRRL